MCGLLASGAEDTVIEPARGPDQFTRILETLAVAEASGKKPLAQLLQDEGRRAGRHTTVIIVTPSVDEEWVHMLGTLTHGGARAAVVQLDGESFGGEEAEPPLGPLAALGVVSYVVPARSDISLMLGPSGVRGDSLLEREPAGAV
jgi:uncharacterized protein (DUF58 family)